MQGDSLTVVEVGCDAGLHDTRHVAHRGQTAGASSEQRENWKAPPLLVQPGDDTNCEGLARRHAHSVEHSQRAAEKAAERHVPLLQTRFCGENEDQPDGALTNNVRFKTFVEEDELTWWAEYDNAFQQRLQLCLQDAHANAACLLQSH